MSSLENNRVTIRYCSQKIQILGRFVAVNTKQQLKVYCLESTRLVLIVREINVSSSHKIHAHFVGIVAHAQSIFPSVAHASYK